MTEYSKNYYKNYYPLHKNDYLKRNKLSNVKNYQKNWAKNKREQDKKLVFDHYGRKCNCCGETIFDFLTIDHEKNDGNKHRKVLAGMNIYAWLIKHNFPKGFKTMCMNCNWGRRWTGTCPHKQ